MSRMIEPADGASAAPAAVPGSGSATASPVTSQPNTPRKPSLSRTGSRSHSRSNSAILSGAPISTEPKTYDQLINAIWSQHSGREAKSPTAAKGVFANMTRGEVPVIAKPAFSKFLKRYGIYPGFYTLPQIDVALSQSSGSSVLRESFIRTDAFQMKQDWFIRFIAHVMTDMDVVAGLAAAPPSAAGTEAAAQASLAQAAAEKRFDTTAVNAAAVPHSSGKHHSHFPAFPLESPALIELFVASPHKNGVPTRDVQPTAAAPEKAAPTAALSASAAVMAGSGAVVAIAGGMGGSMTVSKPPLSTPGRHSRSSSRSNIVLPVIVPGANTAAALNGSTTPTVPEQPTAAAAVGGSSAVAAGAASPAQQRESIKSPELNGGAARPAPVVLPVPGATPSPLASPAADASPAASETDSQKSSESATSAASAAATASAAGAVKKAAAPAAATAAAPKKSGLRPPAAIDKLGSPAPVTAAAAAAAKSKTPAKPAASPAAAKPNGRSTAATTAPAAATGSATKPARSNSGADKSNPPTPTKTGTAAGAAGAAAAAAARAAKRQSMGTSSVKPKPKTAAELAAAAEAAAESPRSGSSSASSVDGGAAATVTVAGAKPAVGRTVNLKRTGGGGGPVTRVVPPRTKSPVKLLTNNLHNRTDSYRGIPASKSRLAKTDSKSKLLPGRKSTGGIPSKAATPAKPAAGKGAAPATPAPVNPAPAGPTAEELVALAVANAAVEHHAADEAAEAERAAKAKAAEEAAQRDAAAAAAREAALREETAALKRAADAAAAAAAQREAEMAEAAATAKREREAAIEAAIVAQREAAAAKEAANAAAAEAIAKAKRDADAQHETDSAAARRAAEVAAAAEVDKKIASQVELLSRAYRDGAQTNAANSANATDELVRTLKEYMAMIQAAEQRAAIAEQRAFAAEQRTSEVARERDDIRTKAVQLTEERNDAQRALVAMQAAMAQSEQVIAQMRSVTAGLNASSPNGKDGKAATTSPPTKGAAPADGETDPATGDGSEDDADWDSAPANVPVATAAVAPSPKRAGSIVNLGAARRSSTTLDPPSPTNPGSPDVGDGDQLDDLLSSRSLAGAHALPSANPTISTASSSSGGNSSRSGLNVSVGGGAVNTSTSGSAVPASLETKLTDIEVWCSSVLRHAETAVSADPNADATAPTSTDSEAISSIPAGTTNFTSLTPVQFFAYLRRAISRMRDAMNSFGPITASAAGADVKVAAATVDPAITAAAVATAVAAAREAAQKEERELAAKAAANATETIASAFEKAAAASKDATAAHAAALALRTELNDARQRLADETLLRKTVAGELERVTEESKERIISLKNKLDENVIEFEQHNEDNKKLETDLRASEANLATITAQLEALKKVHAACTLNLITVSASPAKPGSGAVAAAAAASGPPPPSPYEVKAAHQLAEDARTRLAEYRKDHEERTDALSREEASLRARQLAFQDEEHQRNAALVGREQSLLDQEATIIRRSAELMEQFTREKADIDRLADEIRLAQSTLTAERAHMAIELQILEEARRTRRASQRWTPASIVLFSVLIFVLMAAFSNLIRPPPFDGRQFPPNGDNNYYLPPQ